MPASIAVPAVTTAVSTGISLLQKSKANKQARQAQSAIDNYQRQELLNPYEGLQVSTLATDRQREDLARTMSTYGSSASMGGSRALASLAPNLIAQQNQQSAQINANLDQQEAQRQQLIAQGNSHVQQMMEQRENNDLLGLGNQLSIAQISQAQANNNLNQGLVQGLSAIGKGVISEYGGLDGNDDISKEDQKFMSKPLATSQQYQNAKDGIVSWLQQQKPVFNVPSPTQSVIGNIPPALWQLPSQYYDANNINAIRGTKGRTS